MVLQRGRPDLAVPRSRPLPDASMQHLEDIQQTAVYIPYAADQAEEPALGSLEIDLSNDPQLRLDAYKEAWTRCLDRIKFLIAQLYSPVVSDVIHRVPVITISDPSGGSRFLDRLTTELEPEDDDASALVDHLYPNDCVNITVAMKSLIGGFVRVPPKRKSTSVAPYDLTLLQACLIGLLYDFEQFDANVVQDRLYICSPQIARLQLTFILCFSTPSPPAYLQAVLTHASLSLLAVHHFAVPCGHETFFDLLLRGPTLFEFIEDYYGTHTAISILQARTFYCSSTQVLNNRVENVLLQAVDGAREAFAPHRAGRVRLGVELLGVALVFVGPGDMNRAREKRLRLDIWRGAAAASRAVQGEEGEGVRRHQDGDGLHVLLGELHAYLEGLPQDVQAAELEAFHRFDVSASTAEIAEWVEEYLADLLQPLEESTPLWSVWYPGRTPFPSEIINAVYHLGACL
ncbi:hypothetical protein B0H16DRAFT_1723888 [Mycena metata]|uniref:Origin recognition complex subunit 3 N-terminal domain-containing protein n=1 Tax=Mycena metata TaxID=1033252 RepID=A0AAD7IWY4_9AGAR|nr:hypothetical protein B0H16DRAFT_1723888 [Mycena metata]